MYSVAPCFSSPCLPPLFSGAEISSPASARRRTSLSVSELLNDSPFKLEKSVSSPSASLSTSDLSVVKPHASCKKPSRGPWRMEEDRLLVELVMRYGACHWSGIAAHLPHRTGKQARERWINQLNPALKKKNWSADEDRTILELRKQWGNRWSAIAHHLPGRTDNSVKNRFNSTLQRAIRDVQAATSSSYYKIGDVVDSLHARPFLLSCSAVLQPESAPPLNNGHARAEEIRLSPASSTPSLSPLRKSCNRLGPVLPAAVWSPSRGNSEGIRRMNGKSFYTSATSGETGSKWVRTGTGHKDNRWMSHHGTESFVTEA